ncbi:MAG: Smr/MutS family protein [bacterium]
MPRRLSDEEKRLWQRVTKDVKPSALVSSENDNLPSARDQISPAAARLKPASPARSNRAPRSAAVPQRPTVSATHIDPARLRRVRRGRQEIDASLDLHGLTQEQAFSTLRRFIAEAIRRRLSTILIITGKGRPQTATPLHEPGRGILRHRFLHWSENHFKEEIIGIAQAHPKHGGAGAFYVFLRKKKPRKI